MSMLFITAKVCAGHSGMIQRNALESSTLLHLHVELILLGNDEGAEEVCDEPRTACGA